MIAAAALAAALGLGLVRWSGFLILGTALAVLGGLSAGLLAYFFRDPERPLPSDPNKIYASGDGTVMSVAKETPSTTTVRIFLSLFNVHVQRAPCSGRVTEVRYYKGGFKAAMLDSAKLNERCAVTFETDNGLGPVTVEQIAGLVARRIECRLKSGDRAAAGGKYGIIYFGSQVAVHFPESVRVLVAPGDRVAAGLSAIGEWTN